MCIGHMHRVLGIIPCNLVTKVKVKGKSIGYLRWCTIVCSLVLISFIAIKIYTLLELNPYKPGILIVWQSIHGVSNQNQMSHNAAADQDLRCMFTGIPDRNET